MFLGKTTAIAVMLVLWEILSVTTGQCTEGEYSIKNMMLRQHIFKKVKTSNSFECLATCKEDIRCQSFNYVMSKDMCELNNRTKEARPEDFVTNSFRYYYGLVKNRGEQHKL